MSQQLSRIESQDRIDELQEILGSTQKQERDLTIDDQDSINELRELIHLADKAEQDLLQRGDGLRIRAISILSWLDFDDDPIIENDDPSLENKKKIVLYQNQTWLKAMNYLSSYLRFEKSEKSVLPASNLKHLFNIYEKIRHPNCMIALQPKLENFNTIEV